MRSIVVYMLGLSLGIAGGECIGGKWDPDYAWVRDCTPNDDFDGLIGSQSLSTASGSEKLQVGSREYTLSWRLHYIKSAQSGALSPQALPLILGLHSWNEGASVEQLLGGGGEAALIQYEGSWEDLIFMTVALENGNNHNTWWDGLKVDGVPVMWAHDGLVALLKKRVKDACSLLAAAGASGLSGKTVDEDRVYLRGHSMGGTGAYHLGLRHPELFAAVHAHAGYADYDGNPCGNENFCKSFTENYIGTVAENLQMKGLDGKPYPARKYSNMSWFVGEHDGASWTASLGGGRKYEPPYLHMTHGDADDAVSISSADRLWETAKGKKLGVSFLRHDGAHSNENFTRFHWLLGFRRNLSYLAFTNNSTDGSGETGQFNDLSRLGWMNPSIVDETNRYSVKLMGQGRADVTLRRLQKFAVKPNQAFRWWMQTETGDGARVTADAAGVLTIPGVSVSSETTLIVRPEVPSLIRPPAAPAKRAPKMGFRYGETGSLVLFPSTRDGSVGLIDARGRNLARSARKGI